MIIAPSTAVLFWLWFGKSQLTSPGAVRSICALLLRSCQPMRRWRWLRVAESIVMVIVPFEGIGWLMTTPVGEIETPFTAVIWVAVLGKLSALLSWFVSQKP